METVVRTLTTMGILVACGAYVLFVLTGCAWGSLGLAIGGLIGSVIGVMLWHRDQTRGGK